MESQAEHLYRYLECRIETLENEKLAIEGSIATLYETRGKVFNMLTETERNKYRGVA